jgi:hypothetical protein
MFPTLTEKLDPAIYMSNMATLVEHSDTRAILTTDEFAPQLGPAVGCPVFSSSDLRGNAADYLIFFLHRRTLFHWVTTAVLRPRFMIWATIRFLKHIPNDNWLT